MKKTIYLHIGMPKTGTSTIQTFLQQNNAVLESKGVLFPILEEHADNLIAGGNIFHLFYSFNKSTFTSEIKKQEDIIKDFNLKIKPIIDKSNADKIILSSEGLFFLNVSDIKCPFGSEYDVKVIIYVRKPAEWLISVFCQLINKNVAVCNSFNDYIQTANIPYDNIIDCINIFGKENVIIKPYEKEQWKNNNLLEDFMECINVEFSKDLISPLNQNISASRNKVEIMHLINRLKMAATELRKLKRKLSDCEDLSDTSDYIATFSDEDIQTATEKWLPKIREIEKLYGKGKLFINDYPNCYGLPRTKFNKVVLSLEELEILQNAIDKLNQLKNDEIEKLKTELRRHKFFTSWEHNNHKIYKIGFVKLKFKNK